MKSLVIKRSIFIAGHHKRGVSLEEPFWAGLKEIADQRDMTLGRLVASIDQDREHSNLSSAIRLFVLAYYRDQPVSHDPISNGNDSDRLLSPAAVAS